jgi:Ca2+-binding RTX toxin-like protein
MFSYFTRRFGNQRRSGSSRRRSELLLIEPLEDRMVPTVFITPRFGAENLVPTAFGDFNYTPLVSPDVHLIFWGSYWNTNSAQVDTLKSDFQAIVSSPYTSGMTDYHSAGLAFNGGVYTDLSSSPPQGYDPGNGNATDVNGHTSFSDLQTEIGNVINDSASGIPAPPSDGDAIYVVVTATGTGASYNAPGKYFLPSGFPIPMEMISLSFVPNDFQGCEATFSHELIEAMSSDPVGAINGFDCSVGVTPPASLPSNLLRGAAPGSPAQICDNEPEAYGYRIGGPTGQVVAPYWFNATLNGGYLLGQGDYIVPDGNSEQVTLQAKWTIDPSTGNAIFNGNYNLSIGPVDGTVTLTGYGAGWQISINGQNFFFDPQVNPIANLTLTMGNGNDTVNVEGTNTFSNNFVTINLGNGTDTVNVEGTSVFTKLLSVNLGGGADTVNLTPTTQFLGHIESNVTINGGAGIDTLNVNDQQALVAQPWTLTSSSVANSISGTINYFDINQVTINGGTGNNIYNVRGTESFFVTTLNTGGGTDTVNVQATGLSSTLNINGNGKGNDVVNIGGKAPSLGGTVANIAGAVNVSNSSGHTTLNVDDSGDTTGRTVTVTSSSVSGTWAPAAINYTGGHVSALNLLGGDGGNTFNVLSTASGTTTAINVNDTKTASTNNAVNIGSLAPSLGGALANIAGPVNVSNSSGTTALVLDDSGDTAGRTVTVTNNSISGTWAPAAINYTPGPFSTLTLLGGDGGNTFNVLSTASGMTTAINVNHTSTESNNNVVNIGSLAPSLGGTLTNIAGSVNVSNSSGTTALVLDDSGDTTARTATIANDSVSGTWSSGAINFSANEVSSLTLHAGNAANTFNVQSTTTATNLDLAGLSTVNVGSGGSTSTLSGLLGPLTVAGTGSGNTLNVNDQGDTVGRNYTLSSTVLTCSGLGSITYSGIASLAINGGSGNDALTLLSPAPTVATTFNGGGGTNTLTGPNTTNDWTINAANGGTLGSLTFSSAQNLVGGSGLDVFAFAPGGSVSGSINGGGAPLHQGDWLDYSALSTAVTVNLVNGSATGVAGGAAGKVSNIQNVHGGTGGGTLTGNAQGNILIGGAGAYTIAGGTGASILIADKAAAHIKGGSGGDILIGGLTTFDAMTTANEAALMSILAEWQSSDSYATRFHDIDTGTGGGLNGTNKLNFGTTVKGAGLADTLTGGSFIPGALDWFFASGGDKILNKEKGEHVNNT